MNELARAAARTLLILLVGTSFATAKPALEELSEKVYAVPPNVSLTVRNTDGTIYIYGWDHAKIKVTARKKAYSAERLKEIAVNVKIDGDHASIDTSFPPKPQGLGVADRSGTVDYIILVPEKCSVTQTELSAGEIILEGLRGGAANARLTNGRITTRNCFAGGELTIQDGALDIYHDWWEPFTFAVRGSVARGRINVLLPLDANVRLSAKSGDGKVTNKFAEGDEPREARELNAKIGEGTGAEFNLQATNGNITIHKAK